MKSLAVILMLSLVLFLSACESLKSWVDEKVHGPSYRQRVYHAEQEKVYDAALAVMKGMGFANFRGGLHQGWLEASSRIVSNDSFTGASQISAKLKFSPSYDGEGSIVAAAFIQTVHDNAERGWTGSGSRQVRDSTLYGIFFQNLDEALGKRGTP